MSHQNGKLFPYSKANSSQCLLLFLENECPFDELSSYIILSCKFRQVQFRNITPQISFLLDLQSIVVDQMGISFKQQVSAIFAKNLKTNWRSRATLKELVNLAIMVGVVVALKSSGSSSSTQFIPIYMSIAIMMFCRGVALSWVGEKQSKQAEVQKIMGTTNSAYFTGWFLFFILNGVFLSAIYVGTLQGLGVFKESTVSFGTIVGLYALYMLSSFSFVLFLSSFFSDALLASQIITFVQLLGSMLYNLLLIQGFASSKIAMQVTALLPSVCFEFTVMKLGFAVPPNNPVFTKQQGFITLGCEAVGYFILFLYLEQVLPNDNGSHKHPLFFLQCFKRKEEKSELEEKIQLANLSSARYFQESKDYKKISMYLKDMSKSFDSKTVVDKLSLSLFEKEVFCLLGHNGAGKSTTINMLTGILQPDSGVINIFGYDYYTQMNEIRNRTGVCLQVDVLYNDLTVREHIEFYSKIKGIPINQANAKVDEMIAKCGLQEEQNKKAKELSGGNKRKTCLACASIGNSDLIFLDEPSSGLDPNSRKIIWGLINDLRAEGRTIVLTTHHLQEAEALANRIGILAHGQLLVLGSCHYIKEKFGCGYYLQISLKTNENLQEQKKKIRKEIRSQMKIFNQDEQVNEVSMRFQLPLTQQEYFSKFFNFLEEEGVHFSLRLSSLEDIFIKIGMQPNSVMNNQPLPELEKIEIPEYESKFDLSTQYKAIFLKKARTTFRSFSVVTSIFLPVMFIVVGVVIAMIAYKNPPNQNDAYIYAWAKFYTIGYFMALAFSFNTASYCGNIVRERQIKFSYLAYVMGMKKLSYWLGTMSFDILMFWLPFTILFLVIGCFPSSENQLLVNSFGWLALSLLLFSFSFLSFTYLWSFAFTSARSAYRFYPFLMFLFFYILPQIPTYIIPTNPILPYALPILSPLLGLTGCMVSRQMIGSENFQPLVNTPGISLYTTSEIWYPLLIMAVQGVFYLTMVMILDNLKFNLNDRQELDDGQMNFNKSADLVKEKAKIKDCHETKPILVDNLYKKYPNGYIAIRDNSFIIQKGETFGLLGPNGAGKSTTFNILTAAIPKTHGHVLLNGHEVNRSVNEIFTTVGVCPQFNPIYDELTTQQHIEFFAGIKGLNGDERQRLLDFYIINLQLEEYRHVKAGKLSGGNKRKLCVVMSLIGNPSLVFLDEPSAGVDPIARRYLWNVLHSSALQKKRSIVMTTHSINQAESLCDRIGILIKGEFFCIDSPLELKKRYGKGYRAMVKCDSFAKMDKVTAEIKKNFANYTEERFPDDLKISFQFPKEHFVFSKAFELFYNVFTKEKTVMQFEIAETTLEQVFIFLSKMQVQVQHNLEKQASSSLCCWERNSSGCYCIC